MPFIKILLAEGSTLAKVLVPFFPPAVSVFSFAKMVALASSGGGQCRSPPDRWLASSLVLPCHPRTTHRAASTTSEPRMSDWGCRVTRTLAKMVDAQRRQLPLPRWRRAASGTRLPNPLQMSGQSSRCQSGCSRGKRSCSRAPGQG